MTYNHETGEFEHVTNDIRENVSNLSDDQVREMLVAWHVEAERARASYNKAAEQFQDDHESLSPFEQGFYSGILAVIEGLENATLYVSIFGAAADIDQFDDQFKED